MSTALFDTRGKDQNNKEILKPESADQLAGEQNFESLLTSIKQGEHQSTRRISGYDRCTDQPKKFRATYSVREDIGSGSFATVKRARHRETQKQVALKVLDKSRVKPLDIVSARAEADILMKLSHPNILGCIDFFESPKYIVIVLPLMQATMIDYLDKFEEPLGEDEVKKIFKKIVAGVEYCHERGVMHCDLKLENILINYNEDTMEITDVCISDFGLCSNKKLLKSGTESRGSVPYMAPELFYEGEFFDSKVDCWSLGIILHALLTLEFPFNGDSDEEVRDEICDLHPDFIEKDAWDQITIDACDLTEKLLCKDPQTRLNISDIKEQSWFADSPFDAP